MTETTTLTPGTRVKFVGFNARPWETVGTVTAVGGPNVEVLWGDRPGFLHASQVEAV